MITPKEAKQIIEKELKRRKLGYNKLTARTIDFTDLARDKMIFVHISGWEPNSSFSDLQLIAISNGFRVEV